MHTSLLTPTLIAAAIVGIPSQSTQTSAEREALLQAVEKRPEPLSMVPSSLRALVSISQAAVVARLVDFGDMVFLEDKDSRGRQLGTDAFGSYQVTIREVLFNRETTGPKLGPGQSATFTQAVSGKEARAFISRQLPVSKGDECLMFLWHRPGASTWSILDWPLQFRRSAKLENGAESVTPLSDRTSFATSNRLGGRVTMFAQPDGSQIVDWSGLIGEVKRVALLPRIDIFSHDK